MGSRGLAPAMAAGGDRSRSLVRDAVPRHRPGSSPSPGPRTGTPQRFPSPSLSNRAPAATSSQPRRSTSVERRPSTPTRSSAHSTSSTRPSSPSSASARPSTPVDEEAAFKASQRNSSGRGVEGLWPPMRSLNASFQVEPKKEKSANIMPSEQPKTRDATAVASEVETKRLPLRRRNAPDQSEELHPKLIDHHRWPAMTGGRLSASTASRSSESTEAARRSSVSSVSWRGSSPGIPSLDSTRDVLSRSMDLTDKIKRFVSSTMNSRRDSPMRLPVLNGSVGTPERTDLVDEKDKPDHDTAQSPGTSPTGGSELDAAIVPTSIDAAVLAMGPLPGSDAISESLDLAAKINVPVGLTVRISPGRIRLSSDGHNAMSGSTDSAARTDNVSSTSVSNRGTSPRRVPAAYGATDKDNGPMPVRSMIGNLPRKMSVSDGASAMSRSNGVTSSSRGMSPRRVQATEGAKANVLAPVGTLSGISSRRASIGDVGGAMPRNAASMPSRGTSPKRVQAPVVNATVIQPGPVDVAPKDNGAVTAGSPIGMSPRLSVSDAASATSRSTDSVSRNSDITSTSVSNRELSPRRMLSSNGVSTQLMSLAVAANDRGLKLHTSLSSEGTSPTRSLRSEGANSASHSAAVPTSADFRTRGVSPKRTGSSDASGAFSRTSYPKKSTAPISSLVSSRGTSPRKAAKLDASANLLSRSIDLSDIVKRPCSPSIQMRGTSPRRVTSSDHAAKGRQILMEEMKSPPSNDISRGSDQQFSPELKNPVSLDRNGEVQLKELSDEGSPALVKISGSSANVSPTYMDKVTPLKRLTRTLSSPARGQIRPSSPARGQVRPSSPSKALTATSSSLRRLQSPSRAKPSTPTASSSAVNCRSDSASSVFHLILNVMKDKKSPSHAEACHILRLLHNRCLQWRFINANSDEILEYQKMQAESMLHSVWSEITQLCYSVTMRRTELQQMKQEMKLEAILTKQVRYLDDWTMLEVDHSASLLGTVEALKASTIQIPVVAGAKSDVFAVKNAVSSAVDVMQAMGSSVCYMLSKVKRANSVISELSLVAAEEKAMLDECKALLVATAALQVQECSLRSQLMQRKMELR